MVCFRVTDISPPVGCRFSAVIGDWTQLDFRAGPATGGGGRSL